MQNNLKLHHIGYAVPDIKTTAKEFEKLGFLQKETLYDEALTVELCYLEKDGTIIELVCQKNPESLEVQLINRGGIMPYHLCFSCGDIFASVSELEKNGYDKLFEPIEVKALNGKKICYLYKKEVGYMELVEE